jgi:hypothetical protein
MVTVKSTQAVLARKLHLVNEALSRSSSSPTRGCGQTCQTMYCFWIPQNNVLGACSGCSDCPFGRLMVRPQGGVVASWPLQHISIKAKSGQHKQQLHRYWAVSCELLRTKLCWHSIPCCCRLTCHGDVEFRSWAVAAMQPTW